MACILITGANGFLGGAVARALAARGDRVIAFDRVFGAALTGLAEAAEGLTLVPGDMTEWAAVAAVLQAHRPDAIVHAAAIVGVLASAETPVATMRVNVEGSLNLFEAMRLFGVRRVIHISSEEVYGPFRAALIDEDHPKAPLMAYGISKYAVERLGLSYAERYGLESVNLRLSWIYGAGLPRPRVPKNMIDAAIEEKPLHLPGGADARIDHTYVDDAVAAILGALDLVRHPYDAYNIATGSAPSVGEIAAIVKELVPGADISVASGAYLHAAGLPAVEKGALDITRARESFGYQPKFDIRAGLSACLDEIRDGWA